METVKPGYKTTEFWLALVANVVGGLMASGVVGEGSALERVIGVASMVLTALGYGITRGWVKNARLPALLLLIPALLLSSCAGVPVAYLEADRATYQAVAPKLAEYIEADAAMAAPAKDLWRELLRLWGKRIDEAAK